LELASKMPRGRWVLVNLSGRGDKDLEEYARRRGLPA
jgi:tryptophan synthase beta subunit